MCLAMLRLLHHQASYLHLHSFYIEKSNFVWYTSKHSFSTQSPGSSGHPLHIQTVLIGKPFSVFLPLAWHTLHFFTLEEAHLSAGASLLAGQWFLPVSLVILYRPIIGFSNLGEFTRRFEMTSSRKCRKTSFPP